MSTLDHHEDGGKITLFFSEEQVLFACDQGHWWVVDVAQFGQGPAEHQSDGADDTDRSLTTIKKRFGSEPLRIMNMR